MQTILFPGFSLELHISRIAFQLFGVNIYWYAILIVSAIIIGLLLCKKDDKKYGISFQDIFDLFIYALPIAILSARIYYVIFNFNIYHDNLWKILDFRSGGIAIYGAIIGGMLTCLVFCKKRKIPLLDMLDYIIPFLALGQAIGRWGNFINVEAYGTETTLPWRMGIFENGIYKEVHPTFLYESIITFTIFLILYKMRNKRKYKGQLLVLYFFMYSFARIFIENIRIDSLMIQNVRISQILSIVFFAVACAIMSYHVVKRRKKIKKIENCDENL